MSGQGGGTRRRSFCSSSGGHCFFFGWGGRCFKLFLFFMFMFAFWMICFTGFLWWFDVKSVLLFLGVLFSVYAPWAFGCDKANPKGYHG